MQSRAEQPPGWECDRPWACYIHSSKYDEASCSQLRSQCMGLTVCTCTALSLTTLTASILHSQTPHSLSQSMHSMSSGQSAAQSMHSMSSGQSAAHSSRACSCSRSSGMTGQGCSPTQQMQNLSSPYQSGSAEQNRVQTKLVPTMTCALLVDIDTCSAAHQGVLCCLRCCAQGCSWSHVQLLQCWLALKVSSTWLS